MKTIRKQDKYQDDSGYLVYLAIRKEYGYAATLANGNYYVGNNTILEECEKEEADLRVIANGENYFYKEQFTPNRY